LASVPLVLLLISSPSFGDDALDAKVNEASEALTEATQEVLDAQKSLAETQAKLPAARAKLADATAKETTARAAHDVAAANAAAAKAKYTEALTKLESKKAEISQLQTKVDQFARSVYQQGQASQWEIILESKDPADLTSRLEAIKAVSQASANSLNELTAAKDQLATDAAAAEVVKLDMQNLEGIAATALATAAAAQNEAEKAKAEVDKLVAQEKKDLKVAEDDRAKVKQQYDELRAEQIRIAAQSKMGSVGNGDPEATGPLQWPLPGRGTSWKIGWRVHPVYGYKSCHTGIDISAPGGTQILAADGGIVLQTFYSRAYGNVTLIDHGGGLVTMYAHQSAYLVSAGQVVSALQPIGRVGTTGYSTGNHLHFEVHVNGVPYNPRGWFGGSKTVVDCWSG
jgi:murein DD-endopeptidase MepM/ murein hydrolase activator NlpD